MGISTCINTCSKREKEENSLNAQYFIEENPISIPQSTLDIKVKTSNFIVQRNDSKVYEAYEKLQFLGEGSFGSVYKVRRKNSGQREIIRAMKEISKEKMCLNEENSQEIRNEISVLKNLDHPNIMKIYEFYEDKENMYLITEFCGGDVSNIQDKYGVFPEFLVKYIMYQVFMAITFFHSNKIVHTDIKRENISFFYRDEKKEKKYIDDFLEKFFTDKEITEELINSSGLENLSETSSAVARELSNFDVKILDFGSAKKKINRSHLSGVTGTVYYCSPEIVNDKYDFECDEWACGVMMYILFVAEPPFQGESEEEIFSKILKDEPNLDVEALNDVSDNCKDLIKKLLEKDSKKRIKACDALKHPFFTNGINIGNLFKGKYKENNEILKSFYKRKTQEIQEKKGSKFRDMVMAYITLNFSEKEEEKKARKIFMEMSGGDNHFLIRKNTFVKRLNSIYKNESKEKIEELFDSIDEDKSGNIEYEELIRALTDKNKLLTDKNLKDAFGFFDKDKNGSISWNEIAEVIYPDGQIPKQIMKDFMKEIGEKDENKEITFEQFKKILTE